MIVIKNAIIDEIKNAIIDEISTLQLLPALIYELSHLTMGVGSRRYREWIFIHGTDIVDRDLIVLFFGLFLLFLFFSLAPLEEA